MKLKQRSVKVIRAGPSDCIDHTTRRAAKLGRVSIGQHLEFKDGLNAQKNASD